MLGLWSGEVGGRGREVSRTCKSKQIETGGLTSRHLSHGIVPMPDEIRETGDYMTDIMMTEYRHAKIADLLVIAWACKAADSDNAPEGTTPSMAGDVVNSLFKAVRGLLDADYDDWLVAGGTGELMRSDFKDRVCDQIMDNNTQEGYNVTSIINFVLGDV